MYIPSDTGLSQKVYIFASAPFIIIEPTIEKVYIFSRPHLIYLKSLCLDDPSRGDERNVKVPFKSRNT